MKTYLSALAVVCAFVVPGLALAHGDTHGKAQVIELSVTEKGFEPANARVKVGESVKLVVTRKTDSTCAKKIVLPDYDVKKDLPLNKAVTITFEPKKTGEIKYSCGMNMLGGALTVE